MPGRDPFRAEGQRVVEKGVELDLAVAEHIRVRRAPAFVFGQEVGEHPLAVFADEVHRLDLDANHIGHGCRVDQILARRRSTRRYRRLPSSS